MIDLKKGVEIGEACDKCGHPMLMRVGKFGPFTSAYPECTNTREVETQEPESESGEEEIEPCENCGKPMAVKRGRFGPFLACSGYPECKTTRKLIANKQGGLTAAKRDQVLDELCPKCNANLVVKQDASAISPPARGIPSAGHQLRPRACVPKDADKGGEVVERKSGAGNRSSAARTTRIATSCSGTARSSNRAPSATRRTWSRRSPRSWAASCSATTTTAITRDPRHFPKQRRRMSRNGS
jgi:DNA topoisomerase-1